MTLIFCEVLAYTSLFLGPKQLAKVHIKRSASALIEPMHAFARARWV